MLDAVIEVVVTDDRDTFVDLLQVQSLGCTRRPEIYEDPPRCPEDAEEGTIIQVLPVTYMHFGWDDREPAEITTSWFPEERDAAFQLYAVVPAEDSARIEASYYVVFGTEHGLGRAMWVSDAGITALAFLDAGGAPAPQFVRRIKWDDFLIPPPVPGGLVGQPE